MVIEHVPGPLRFTPRKNWQSDHGGRCPQKTHFIGLIITLTWSNGFCGERGKRDGMVRKGRAHGKKMLLYYFVNEFLFGGFIYNSSH
jgi:hypothetical protein